MEKYNRLNFRSWVDCNHNPTRGEVGYYGKFSST